MTQVMSLPEALAHRLIGEEALYIADERDISDELRELIPDASDELVGETLEAISDLGSHLWDLASLTLERTANGPHEAT